MKIIINKNSKDDLEKLKKIYIALGKDFEEIDKKAVERGHVIKDEKKLKQEIKAESEKPDKPKKDKP